MGAASCVGELVSVAKFGEFLEAELRAIVASENLRDTMLGKHCL